MDLLTHHLTIEQNPFYFVNKIKFVKENDMANYVDVVSSKREIEVERNRVVFVDRAELR